MPNNTKLSKMQKHYTFLTLTEKKKVPNFPTMNWSIFLARLPIDDSTSEVRM